MSSYSFKAGLTIVNSSTYIIIGNEMVITLLMKKVTNNGVQIYRIKHF